MTTEIQQARLRCKKCTHLINLHKYRNKGGHYDNGYCCARYCLCRFDRYQLESVGQYRL